MTPLRYVKCSMPNCNNRAGQHDSRKNKNKQMCEPHRKSKKHEVDQWKISQGCANKHGKYGFACCCKFILDASQLDINHIDGNNTNRDPSNIEVLCKMCHTLVTIKNQHHLNPNPSRRLFPAKTDLFQGLD